MKKTLMLALALIISVAFVTTVFAQSATKEATKAVTDTSKEKVQAAGDATIDKALKADKPAKAKTLKAKGEVVKISEEEGIVVVKGKKGDVAYDIKDVKWSVYKDAKEVKTGEIVVISYIDKDGKKVAKVIGKSVKKEKKAATPKVEDKPAATPDKPAAEKK